MAGRRPAEDTAPLAGKKLWVVVAEDNDKAYAGENAILEEAEVVGVGVGRAVWDAQATPFAAEVGRLSAAGASINFVAFRSGTVTPAGCGGGGSAHMATWRIAYTIESIRDWLSR